MITVPISAGQLFRIHVKVIAALAAAHLALMIIKLTTGHDMLLGIAEIFRLDWEGNLPTFVSSVALLLAGLAAYLAGEADDRALRGGWRLAAGCAAYLAVDEACMLHDHLSTILQKLSGESGPLWTIPYLLLAAVVGVVGLPWLRRLPPVTRNGLLAAGALYVFSAAVLEIAEGAMFRAQDKAAFMDPLFMLLTMMEEVGEMLAVAFALRVILRHLEVVTGARQRSGRGEAALAPAY